MGNNNDTVVGTPFIIELEGKADKIVPIPGHKTASFEGRPLQLLKVRQPFGHDLVNTDRIQPPIAEQFRDPLAQVLIQVVFQD